MLLGPWVIPITTSNCTMKVLVGSCISKHELLRSPSQYASSWDACAMLSGSKTPTLHLLSYDIDTWSFRVLCRLCASMQRFCSLLHVSCDLEYVVSWAAGDSSVLPAISVRPQAYRHQVGQGPLCAAMMSHYSGQLALVDFISPLSRHLTHLGLGTAAWHTMWQPHSNACTHLAISNPESRNVGEADRSL